MALFESLFGNKTAQNMTPVGDTFQRLQQVKEMAAAAPQRNMAQPAAPVVPAAPVNAGLAALGVTPPAVPNQMQGPFQANQWQNPNTGQVVDIQPQQQQGLWQRLMATPGIAQALLQLSAVTANAQAQGQTTFQGLSQGFSAFGKELAQEKLRLEEVERQRIKDELQNQVARQQLQGLTSQNQQAQMELAARQVMADPNASKSDKQRARQILYGDIYAQADAQARARGANTDIGKLAEDLRRGFITQEQYAQLVSSAGEAPAETLEGEQKLRKELLGQAGEFVKIADSYNRLQAVATGEPSGASDIALVYSYMKMLDPGSVVREGEFATAENAGGIDARVRNIYNKVLEGELLSPKVRQDYLAQAGKIYSAQEKSYKRVEGQYKNLAKQYGLNPERVALPIGANVSPDAQGAGLAFPSADEIALEKQRRGL